jgi:hypothetical protein
LPYCGAIHVSTRKSYIGYLLFFVIIGAIAYAASR